MQYDKIVLDLDGTLFRGERVITDAPSFIQAIKRQNCACLFVTNNSSKTPEQVAQKLNQMGIPADLHEIYTSSLATAAFIQQDATRKQIEAPRAYVIGETGLMQALLAARIRITDQDPHYVVVGIDRQFHYDKLKTASQWVANGATLIGTNPDRALPVEDALLPGAGSLMHSVVAATGVEPVWIGKPSSIILDYALRSRFGDFGYNRKEILMVGDNMETDIQAADRFGIDSALVLTGFTKREQIDSYPYRPTFIAESLSDLMEQLSLSDT
jgi:4-nitrophenyl phosphatase